MEPIDDKPVRLTIAEAANLAGTSEKSIRNRVKEGKLAAEKQTRGGRAIDTVDPDELRKLYPEVPDGPLVGGQPEEVPGVPLEQHTLVVAERDRLVGANELLTGQLHAEQKQAATLTLELGKAQAEVQLLGPGGGAEVRNPRRWPLYVLGFVALAAAGGSGIFLDRSVHAKKLADESALRAEKTLEVADLREQLGHEKTKAGMLAVEADRKILNADTARAKSALELERVTGERDELAEEARQARVRREVGEVARAVGARVAAVLLP